MKSVVFILSYSVLILMSNPVMGQSYKDWVVAAKNKYLKMETMCGIIQMSSEKSNINSSSKKLIYTDNRRIPWRLIVLPEYRRYIFYQDNQTYSFNEENKTYFIDQDTFSILRLNNYLDNISGILLTRNNIVGNYDSDTTTTLKTVYLGKGINEIIITARDMPDMGITGFVFRMDIDTVSKTPLNATTSYLFLDDVVIEKAELDSVYSDTIQTNEILSLVHKMMTEYTQLDNAQSDTVPEKEFRYKDVLEKLEFVNQPPGNSKFYLLDFYYVNCGPCLKSISYLKGLQGNYSDTILAIIAVNPLDTKEKIENYVIKNNISYVEAKLENQFIIDNIGHIGYPFFVLFDESGTIVLKQTGFDPAFFDQVREIINK